jgi:hypothetical protein
MNELEIPQDFPMREAGAGLAGAQPKLSVVESGGRYYTLGNDPPSRLKRYKLCIDLIEQFAVVARKTKAGKRRDMPEAEILAQYQERLLVAGWDIDQREAVWIFEKVAERLGWPPPFSIGVTKP